MKSMVIYNSEFGNTRELALAIAAQLEAAGPVQTECVRSNAPVAIPGDVSLLVVGGPTQVHRVSPPLRRRLEASPKHALDGVQAAAFDTRSHGAHWSWNARR